MKKAKPDSPQTIIRCQIKEINDLMASERGWKADAEYYKEKYNKRSAECDELRHRLWQYDIVEKVLLRDIDSLKAAIEGKPKP